MNAAAEGNQPPNAQPEVQKLSFGKKKGLPFQLRNLIRRLQQNYPFFADMLEDEVGDFLRLCKREAFQKGQTIFTEGEVGDTFYLILSGEVGILVGSNEVAHMGPGQLFGEMALLDDAPRTATAVATEPALLFSISRLALGTKVPVLGFKVVVGIARQLAAKLREANDYIKKLETRDGDGE